MRPIRFLVNWALLIFLVIPFAGIIAIGALVAESFRSPRSDAREMATGKVWLWE